MRRALALAITMGACRADPSDSWGPKGMTDSEPADSEPRGDSDSPVDTDPQEVVLDGEADAKLVGEDDGQGRTDPLSVAGAGDVDADGFDDVLVGRADCDRGGGDHSGAAYVVRGPISGTFDLALADAILVGSSDEYAGSAVAGGGDVNGDGFSDVLVGAPLYDSADHIEGQVYLVNGPVSGEIALSGADAIFHGDESECTGDGGWDPCDTGTAVALLGDVDGDGFDDVAIGAPRTTAAYLIRGPIAGMVELATDADATVSGGSTGEACSPGEDVAAAGDVDGDGLDDALIGCFGNDGFGAVFVFSAFPNGALTQADADAVITELTDEYVIGIDVASAGDTNADGYADIILAAPGDEAGADAGGGAVVFLGPLQPTADASEADAALHSAVPDDVAGDDVAGVGDVNGDSYADVLIGATGNQPYLPGRAYLVHGPFAGSMSLADADYRMEGDGIDMAGDVLSPAGDVDSDGLADVLIGGPYDEEGGDYTGAAWLILGASLP